MAQLKARITRVEDRTGSAEREQSFEFGGDVLIQDFAMQESSDGEMVEVSMGDIRRLFVMDSNYTPKPRERVLGFEPMMITHVEFNQAFKTVLNTSRSI